MSKSKFQSMQKLNVQGEIGVGPLEVPCFPSSLDTQEPLRHLWVPHTLCSMEHNLKTTALEYLQGLFEL